MDGHESLAERFESHRTRLRAVAFRVLGSDAEAEDAVQEAWLRLSRSDSDDVANLGGWLTTVVGRICLDMLRARAARREEPLEVGEGGPGTPGAAASEAAATAVPPAVDPDTFDPERQAVLADSVGLALLVVLDTLSPAERLAFVLHDMFAVPFDQIGGILGRSPDAAKMLASRARRRVQGSPTPPGTDPGRQREVVTAFLAASREGNFEALVALLAPDAVLTSDAVAAATGAPARVDGARAVAETFAGRARAARLALIDGLAGLLWSQGGQVRVVFGFTLTDGLITEIGILADPERLADLELTPVDG